MYTYSQYPLSGPDSSGTMEVDLEATHSWLLFSGLLALKEAVTAQGFHEECYQVKES